MYNIKIEGSIERELELPVAEASQDREARRHPVLPRLALHRLVQDLELARGVGVGRVLLHEVKKCGCEKVHAVALDAVDLGDALV